MALFRDNFASEYKANDERVMHKFNFGSMDNLSIWNLA